MECKEFHYGFPVAIAPSGKVISDIPPKLVVSIIEHHIRDRESCVVATYIPLGTRFIGKKEDS